MSEKSGSVWHDRPGAPKPARKSDGRPRPPERSPRPADGGADRARGTNDGGVANPRPLPWWLILLALVALNYFVANRIMTGAEVTEVPYSVFREQIEANNVAWVCSCGDVVNGEFRTPVTYPSAPATDLWTDAPIAQVEVTRFRTTLPAFLDPGFEAFLRDHGVEIASEPIGGQRNTLVTLLFSFGPAALMIVLVIVLSRRMASGAAGGLGGAFGMGQAKARRYDESAARVTFDDVAGIDEAKHELAEIVDFLKSPQKYTRLGGTAPKGVLLVGSPGTGKTLLAKAVAGEAGVPFFSMNASEFVEMIVGVGASRVRDLFDQARKAAPAIIFIDELDAIGRSRGRISFGGSSEQEQTLNQILTEMDGFSTQEGVIVLAATNRPDVLDPALLRAGRFDRHVTVQPPDKAGRTKILEVHSRGVPLAQDVDLGAVAGLTPGLVGADLRNLVNEAAILAASRNEDAVRQRDFEDALEKITLGPERKLLLNPKDRERVAYHEAGHAILGIVVPGADPVARVTITPRGRALGVTYQRPTEDRYNYPEAYLRGRIVGALGGRAAEEVIYGDRTTGAENDLQQATKMASGMVTRWGMSEALGPVALSSADEGFLGEGGGAPEAKPYSEATAALIDREIRAILDASYESAKDLLRRYRPALDALALALQERESLDEREVLEVTGLTPHADHA